MKLSGDFYIVEIEKSETHTQFIILPGDQEGDPRVNYAEDAKYNKKVRLLKCVVADVLEAQS
jgi:hypothetical protein